MKANASVKANPLLADYLRERSMLLRVAYRILGSQSEAEDVLQDVYLKIMGREDHAIDNTRAWMIRILVNTAIDQKRSFHQKKIEYVGSWLPEPFVEESKSEREVKDDATMALMVLLERLNPIERAVFVLRETCELPYDAIAEVLGMSEAACRKSWQRAEAHIEEGRKRFRPDPEKHRNLTLAFMQFWGQGNTEELIRMLQADAVFYSDGGGKVTATAAPIEGAKRILKFLMTLNRAAGVNTQVRVHFLPPDQACLIMNDKLETVICLETDGAIIQNLYFMRNPDKMERIKQRLVEVGALAPTLGIYGPFHCQ